MFHEEGSQNAFQTKLTFIICFSCVERGEELRSFIKGESSAGCVIIIVGAVDEDLHVAASTKSFLLGGAWVKQGGKVVKYGIPTPSPSKMGTVINIIANQSVWYYKSTFNDPVHTKVVALCRANTYGRYEHPNEKEMAEKFQAVLKNGDDNQAVKQALMCHLMAAIAHDSDFKEVQDWACAPSSSTNLNPVMEELKEHVRHMMYGRKSAPIFIRHTAVSKSRSDGPSARKERDYCQKHFASIHVNPEYKNKLKGRVVCVFDDYLTHGNTFETLRNLLISCRVKKIIFVAIGKFLTRGESSYKQRSFLINGDIHTPRGYSAEVASSLDHKIEINEDAKRSLRDLNYLAKLLIKDCD